MSEAAPRDLAGAVLQLYPRTFSEELGLRSLDTPSGSFRLLVMALLMSARIRASTALDAARALFRRRWTTPSRMADAPWDERARVLNESGYARYDERTSTALGDTAQLIVDRYGGDLRRLRCAADRDPTVERRLLKQCKGIGDVGVDIFFREAQRTWAELYPFADRRPPGPGGGPPAGTRRRRRGAHPACKRRRCRPAGQRPGPRRPRRCLRGRHRAGLRAAVRNGYPSVDS